MSGSLGLGSVLRLADAAHGSAMSLRARGGEKQTQLLADSRNAFCCLCSPKLGLGFSIQGIASIP